MPPPPRRTSCASSSSATSTNGASLPKRPASRWRRSEARRIPSSERGGGIILPPLFATRYSLLPIRFPPLLDTRRKRCLVLEHRDGGRLAAEAQLLPARHHVVIGGLGQLGTLGKGLEITVVHAGVDQALRAPGPDFRRIEAGIQEGAPGLAQDIDRLRRARTGGHGP